MILMTDSEQGGIILIALVILFAVGFIYMGISTSIDRKNNIKLVENTLKPILGGIDIEIKNQLIELSKWVIACEKCNHRSFRVKTLENISLIYTCNSCNKNKTLKYDNTFYHIHPIPKLNDLFSKMIMEMNKYNLPSKYVESKREGYDWQKPLSDLMDSLNYNYFTFKNYQKHTKWLSDTENLTFNSEGSEMEKVVEELENKKIKKLSPNRKDLNDKVIKEWSYKKITTGSKSEIIKNWAKKSGFECIDGSKCNGVKFQDLPNNEITFGHIIPQSWGVEYPHMLKIIHHPDNLYLTCKSCNSSLNSNFPQTELKNKISKREGTIGDWLRTHIRDFEH